MHWVEVTSSTIRRGISAIVKPGGWLLTKRKFPFLFAIRGDYELNQTRFSLCVGAKELIVRSRCYNCQNYYNMDPIGNISMYYDICSSSSFSIAPIPASIMSTWSQHNATFKASITPPANTGNRASSSNANSFVPTGDVPRTDQSLGGSRFPQRTTSRAPNIFPGLPTMTFVQTLNGFRTGSVQPVQSATGVVVVSPPQSGVELRSKVGRGVWVGMGACVLILSLL